MQTAEEGKTLSPLPATGPADSAKGLPQRPPPAPGQVSPAEPQAGGGGIQGHLWNFQRLDSWKVRAGRFRSSASCLPPGRPRPCSGLTPAVDPGSEWRTAGIGRDADWGSAGSADREPQAAGWAHARWLADQLPVWPQLGSSGKLRQGCLLKQGP